MLHDNIPRPDLNPPGRLHVTRALVHGPPALANERYGGPWGFFQRKTHFSFADYPASYKTSLQMLRKGESRLKKHPCHLLPFTVK